MKGFRRLLESATTLAMCGLWMAPLAVSCRGGPDRVEPAWLPGIEADVSVQARPFSGRTALDDARELGREESDAPGQRGVDRARKRVVEALHEMGAATGASALAPSSQATGAGIDPAASPSDEPEVDRSPWIIGVLPGRSDDVIVLAADLDAGAAPEDDARAWTDAMSGPAVLVELGRTLAARPRPYTIWLAFHAPTQANAEPPGLADSGAEGTARAAASGDRPDDELPLERVRLAVFFESLARPDLRVVRDLRSHQVHREAFWSSARALGLEEVFVPDARLGSPTSTHHVLLDRSFRSVVALAGDTPLVALADGEEEPGTPLDDELYAAQTATRLDELGAVVLDALDGIATRLARIDGFAKAPLSAERWEAELPDPGDGAPDSSEAGPVDPAETGRASGEPADPRETGGVDAPPAASSPPSPR